MNIQQLQTISDKKARSLFGLNRNQLAELLLVIVPALCERRRRAQENRPNRKRAPGAGRKRGLSPLQEALLTLVYLRHNVSHTICGHLFGVSADKSENVFHEVVTLLAELCPSNRWDAQKRWKRSHPSWRPEAQDFLLIDSFETPVPRPSAPEKQKRLYSGKKRRHTLKTQVVSDGDGEILCIDPGHGGPLADKRLYERSGVAKQFPNARKQADLSYMGLADVGVPHRKPDKRAKAPELTDAQRQENQQLACVRVRIEHGIRRIKAWKILRHDYRLATGLFAVVAHAVVGLVHLSRICA